MNEVVYYQREDGGSPVKAFIESLPLKHQVKALWQIDLLEEKGRTLREPYVSDIEGDQYKGLFELRIKFASDISRIFYFTAAGDKFVLLHGFVKKTNKTPPGELQTALTRMNDYKVRIER